MRFFFVLLTVAAVQAADVKVSELPLKTSVSTNTFILVSDMNEATKSGKYLFTNLVTQAGLTKTAVGLGNVDNTSDANKPISTATQAALDALLPRIEAPFNVSGTEVDASRTNQWFSKALSGPTTLTVAGAVAGRRFSLIVTNDGSSTLTFWTTTWLEGTAPVLDTGTGTVNIFDFYYDGAKWYGTAVQQEGAGAIANTVLGPGSAVTAGVLTKWADTTGTNITSAVAGTDYQAALGFTPVNKAGDTGIGALAIDPADNTTALTLGGYSLTGANAQSLLDLSGTWNTSGNPAALKLAITDTASGATSKAIEVLGGAAGNTALFSVSKAGAGVFGGGVTASDTGGFQIATGGSNYRLGWTALVGMTFFDNNVAIAAFSQGMHLSGTHKLGWSSGAPSATADTSFHRDSAATVQMGPDAATATAQTLKAHDGSGTDKDGAKLTIAGGKSTGTGRGGDLIGQTSLTGTTGSSANSYSTRSYHSAKFVDLTESTATTFANIALAASKALGATLVCTVYAGDGTDFQALTSTVNVNAVNKAGTVTATLTQVDGTTAASAGTLTVTYTAVANAATVDIKANAVSSLTQTQLRVKWSIISLNSDDVGTVTAQ